MKTSSIHGFRVNYEDDALGGLNYLREDLDFEEARVFFDQARSKGYAKFEDSSEGQYTLFYNSSDGTYTLKRR